jgi:hypothetical protein
MNSTNVTARAQTRNQARTANSDSKLKKRKRSATADAKTEFAADFVVGALLYSLLGSNRSESIISVLPENKQS